MRVNLLLAIGMDEKGFGLSIWWIDGLIVENGKRIESYNLETHPSTLRTHSISRWESIDDDGSSHQKSFVSIVHSRSFSSCSVSSSFSLFGGTISSVRKIPVVVVASESSLWKEKEFERVLLSTMGEENSPVASLLGVDIVFLPTSNQPALLQS